MQAEQTKAMKKKSEVGAKWAAVVNDSLVPMPRRRLKASDILHQSGAEKEMKLVRDHNSPHDVGFESNATVDLAEGNVFHTLSECACSSEPSCDAPAKLAFVADDHWEVTIQSVQTGDSLRGLLDIQSDVEMLRDFESPRDEPVDNDDVIEFSDGPVFITRAATKTEITIIVNGRPKVVGKRKLLFSRIVSLAFDPVPTGPYICFTVTYSDGPRANPEGTMIEGDKVKIKERMVFNVTQTDKS